VLAADTTVSEVIVVDDESSDGTAALARGLGATVLGGKPLPSGWVGKPWALDQGLRAASGDWVVSFDADVEPSPGLALALVHRVRAEGLDMASVAGRFECPTAPLRALHPAFLTTLIYRLGPPGRSPRRPGRVLANGQCTVVRRAESSVPAGTRRPRVTSPTTSRWPAAWSRGAGGSRCSTALRSCGSACTRAPATPGARGAGHSPCPT
jgi:dolichol-phosphate mannosyltransferase